MFFFQSHLCTCTDLWMITTEYGSLTSYKCSIGCRMDTQKFYSLIIGGLLNTHSDFCVCQAIVRPDVYTRNCFSETMGSRFGGPGQTALETMNEFTFFKRFLPIPFIQDLFLWRTSNEIVKTDLYPLSLISLWYAVCSTGCWSIIGRCVGACQRSSCAEERRP